MVQKGYSKASVQQDAAQAIKKITLLNGKTAQISPEQK